MILVGRGARTVGFDILERHPCERCDCEQDFALRLKYQYGHFYHLFGWVFDKQYQLVCPTCSHGWIIDDAIAEDRIGRNVIPFRHKSGWIVGVILIHLVAIGAVLRLGSDA